jgi:hypothetical protein
MTLLRGRREEPSSFVLGCRGRKVRQVKWRRYLVDHDGPRSPTKYGTTGLAPTLREVINTPMGKMTVLEIIEPADPDGGAGRLRAKLFNPRAR